jgi:hypothetical protein
MISTFVLDSSTLVLGGVALDSISLIDSRRNFQNLCLILRANNLCITRLKRREKAISGENDMPGTPRFRGECLRRHGGSPFLARDDEKLRIINPINQGN